MNTSQHINEIFNEEVVKALRNNKHEITQELLQSLRVHGNDGKKIACEILDMEKDHEQYYLDAFGSRMSFNGNRRLKKAFTKLKLSPIHEEEIEKCKNDIHYFKDNYVKIKTKAGVNFPEMRSYQNEFIDVMQEEDLESIVGLMGRQSGKSVTVSIYLAHCMLFKTEINIGIVSNKGTQSREFLANTKNILIELPIWLQMGITSWNKGSIETENKMRILTDVPSSDAFRGFTIAILVVDECAFINPNNWDVFADSIFPSQSALAWKKNVIVSTANGLNFYYDIVEGARNDTNGYKLFEVDWKIVPRYKPDGTLKVPEDFKNEVIKKHGIIYFEQNYGNSFIGSSHTLISSNKLKEFKAQESEEKRDGKLDIYKYPEKGHRYIMTVDAAKDGKDAFAVQIIDTFNFDFEQVACANLQIDYLRMPAFIYEWAEYYNFPYLIIENNEGAGQSIADQMYQTYEYQNLHFDNKIDINTTNRTKARKAYPGFRTTTKSRALILQTLKLFIENNKLIINDKTSINELFRFILVNNKYQADEGAKDDMVMSLALAFVPFCNTKNFEDMKSLVKNLFGEELEEGEKADFADLMTIGSFNDGTDFEEEMSISKNTNTVRETFNGYIIDNQGFN